MIVYLSDATDNRMMNQSTIYLTTYQTISLYLNLAIYADDSVIDPTTHTHTNPKQKPDYAHKLYVH